VVLGATVGVVGAVVDGMTIPVAGFAVGELGGVTIPAPTVVVTLPRAMWTRTWACAGRAVAARQAPTATAVAAMVHCVFWSIWVSFLFLVIYSQRIHPLD
jgi:hypothetical protein